MCPTRYNAAVGSLAVTRIAYFLVISLKYKKNSIGQYQIGNFTAYKVTLPLRRSVDLELSR